MIKNLAKGLLIFFGVLNLSQTYGSISLHTLQTQALTQTEFPQFDNNDPIDPSYQSYFSDQKPNAWKRIQDLLKADIPLLRKKQLEKSVDRVLKQKRAPLAKLSINVSAKSRIIIWGDLHGAYHSLLRTLNELVRRGLLDDRLKIQDPNTHLIFTGNIIDRSAYSTETLLLVLELVYQNPQKVIYMRGSHENNGNWRNYDFPRELKDRLGYAPNAEIFDRIDRIFKTLPTQVHLVHEDGRILGINSLYNLDYMAQTQENPEIEILINAQSRSRVYQTTRGFDMLPFESGRPTWTAFSSPTKSFLNLFDFYWDSATIIEPQENWHQARAVLLRHDVRHPHVAFEETYKHLMSGKELKRGENFETQWLDLTIGCPIDLSQGSKILGERLRAGIDLRIRQLNHMGGFQGKLLRVYFVDDQYSPSKTMQIAQDLYKRSKTNLIMTTLGTATTQALLPLVASKKIALMFPYTGDDNLRSGNLSNMIHFRPSYMDEISTLLWFAQNQLMGQKYGIFYTDEPFGRERFEHTKKQLLENYHIPSEQICPVPYPRGTINVDTAVPEIKACNPDILILLSTFDAGRALVQGLGVQHLKSTYILGYSYLTDLFQDFVGLGRDGRSGKGLKFAISRLIPDPHNNQLEIIQEYLKEFARVYPGGRVDVDSLEGYINASILIDLIEKIPEPRTIDQVITAAESIHAKTFKGLTLNFDPQTRELSRQVWIDPGQGQWILGPQNNEDHAISKAPPSP